MNNLHITTSERLKDATPSQVRKVGFLKLGRKYEYDFTSPSEYWRVLSVNGKAKLGEISAVAGGIIRGGAV